MDEVLSIEELYQAYYDCRKTKRKSSSCIRFEIQEAENLAELYHELLDGTYEIGSSICFIVTEPKLREVFAADFRDRIVHHLVINKFNYLFEERFIDNTFNCRKGKGTLNAVEVM